MSTNDPIAALREALKHSPNNIPLRRHLAETLLAAGRFEEAEREYREALLRAPENADLQTGLATAFVRQAKISHAMALLETLVKTDNAPARAHLLLARLLLKSGEAQRAVHYYKQAVEAEPEVRDETLESDLGIGKTEDDDSEVVEGRVRAAEQGPKLIHADDLERPKITFADVGGMEALKEEIRLKIIMPLTHPELFKAYGKAAGGGILMFGPPGCGKTHLARATAGEVHASFLSVGIADVLDMWIGASERNLRDVFENARSHKPCVLFFDEVDALGASRTDMKRSAGRQLINQFLSELDGVNTNNEGVLILAATNAPWHLDTAFRRPGRFDRVLFVPPPDLAARVAILQILLKGKPTDKIDAEELAKKTEGFSGADLKALVDQAVEAKLRDAVKTGIPAPLTTRDLAIAGKSMRPTTREWFSTARNHALYANEGGLYDEVLSYLKRS